MIVEPFTRRGFLGGALAASISTRAALGQPVPPAGNRAAVIIGLDNYPHITPLRAAVSGANDMAQFLAGEGFEVLAFTDEAGEVRAQEIADAVFELVERGTLAQLVVYFSGHGTLAGRSEFWLLSRAPNRPEEAISVEQCVWNARLCGIPNVVLISDACRSLPTTLGWSSVGGQSIFPVPPGGVSVHVDVDRFYAALPGRPALELPLEDAVAQHEGIFTSAFLQAFRTPDPDMIVQLQSGEDVVPNRKLRKYLVREVQARAQRESIRLTQAPDAVVNSEPGVYIGRVIAPAVTNPIGGENSLFTEFCIDFGGQKNCTKIPVPNVNPPPPYPIELSSVSVPNAVESFVQESDPSLWTSDVFESLASPTRVTARREVLDTVDRQSEDEILDETGLAVYGGAIVAVEGPGIENASRMARDPWDVGPDIWRVALKGRSATSALVTFEDGSGAAVPILLGFGIHLSLDRDGIADLRLNPVEGSALFDLYIDATRNGGSYGDLALLRGLATQASSEGVLRFDGTASANALATNIRIGKAIDPMLGLYAAYGYAAGGNRDGAALVHRIMRDDLGATLFDSAMIAGALAEDCARGNVPVVPPAPMMRQGWEYLLGSGARLPAVFEAARGHLMNGLWSTFRPEGMTILRAELAAALDERATCLEE